MTSFIPQTQPESRKSKFFRYENLWAFIALSGVIGVMNLAPIIPNDYWFHLVYGRSILSSYQLPWNDTFSFTMSGQVYSALGVYWLGEVMMELIHQFASGWQTTIYGIIVFAAYLLIYKSSIQRSGSVYAAGVALVIGVVLGATNWNIRPQIFAYFYFAILVYIRPTITAELFKGKWLSTILISVLVIILWQNTHGTFIFGYMLLGSAILQNLRGRQLFGTLLPLLALSLVSPLGLNMPSYLFHMLSENMAARQIIEWQPAYINEITGQIFYPILAITLLLGWIKKPSLKWGDWLVFFALLLLSLRYRRAILFWGMYSIPLVAGELAKFGYFQRELVVTSLSAKLNKTIIFSVALLVLLTFPPIKPYLPIPEERKNSFGINTPFNAVEALRKLPPGNVFADYSYSGYISYETNTEYKIFMDTRFDLYSDAVFEDYLTINGAKNGWAEVAAKYPIDHWLLSNSNQPKLIAALEKLDSVQLVYLDENFTLFTAPDR